MTQRDARIATLLASRVAQTKIAVALSMKYVTVNTVISRQRAHKKDVAAFTAASVLDDDTLVDEIRKLHDGLRSKRQVAEILGRAHRTRRTPV